MFMGNIHGHRLNMDVLKLKGSGFVASYGPDFLLANDAWARFINMRCGPDGKLCVDLNDAKLSRRGILGLQIHAGGPMEVRFKEIKLELLSAKQGKS
jgi:hypothetical protein